jgi:hypothetical protein
MGEKRMATYWEVTTLLWTMAIVILGAQSILFIRRAIPSTIESQRQMFWGIAIFFGCYAVTRACFLGGSLLPTYLYEIYWYAATIIGMVGFITLLFISEKYPLDCRTRFAGSILAFFSLIMSIVLGSELGRFILAGSLPITGLMLFALYVYLIVKTDGEIRRRAIWNTVGLALLLAGITFDANLMRDLIAMQFYNLAAVLQEIVAPILVIVGVMVFAQPYQELEE